MSLRIIASRWALLALLATFLSGCAGEDSGSPDGIAILKLSYFRSMPDPRSKKLEPTFRTVMSESWRDRMGDGPREPLAKAAPGKIYMGYVSDVEMTRYLKRLREFGIDDLKSMDPAEVKPDDFNRLAQHPQESSFTRIFTVGSDKGSKSYWFRQQQTSKDLIEKFVKCEAFISRACENSIQVRTLTDPLPGRDK
jgi:hypothetical protein